MTYDPNIPENLPPGTVIVDQIRANFSQYATVFDNNHEPLNNSNQGKHTNVLLQQQFTAPVVDGSFDAFYSAPVQSNSSLSQELFVKIPQFLPEQFPNNPMQLTFNTVNTAGTQYQSFLAGGYIIYWGMIASATPTIATTITLVPVPTKIVCVIPNPTKVASTSSFPLSPIRVSSNVLSNSQFTINATFPTGTGDIYWLCIGTQ